MATLTDIPSDVRRLIYRKAARLTVVERLDRLLQRRPRPTQSTCGDFLDVSFVVNELVTIDLSFNVRPVDKRDTQLTDVFYEERHWDRVRVEIIDLTYPVDTDPDPDPDVVVVLREDYRRSFYMNEGEPAECIVDT